MLIRAIIAFASTQDYVDPTKKDELTEEASERINILHTRLTRDYFPKTLGRIRVYTENDFLHDLHAIIFASKLGEPEREVEQIVDYNGFLLELDDLGDNSGRETAIFFFHTDGEIFEMLLARWNEMYKISPIRGLMNKPPSRDYLALVIDSTIPKPLWITATDFHKRSENKTTT